MVRPAPALLSAVALSTLLLGSARAGTKASPPAPTPAAAPESALPLTLTWGAPRADVEARAAGFQELLEDVIEVEGTLEGQKGRFNFMIEDDVLNAVRFRMFDTDAVYKALASALTRRWGPEAVPGQWRAVDETVVRVSRQSNEVFVEFTTTPDRCASAAKARVEGLSDAEKAGGTRQAPVFQADKYADDPLENDPLLQQLDDQRRADAEARKKKEEEERQKQQSIKVDWDGDDKDADPAPPDTSKSTGADED